MTSNPIAAEQFQAQPAAFTGSVVIAAFNEEAVIGRCLDMLLADATPGEFEVIVVANGCTDCTVQQAHARNVTVIEVPDANKSAALNLGDRAATSFPRLYLDADITITAAGVRRLFSALSRPPVSSEGGVVDDSSRRSGGALAATGHRQVVLTGSPWLVRAYHIVHEQLPAVRSGLFARGAVAVSQAGRERFGPFPDQTADDLFLDSVIGPDERVVLEAVVSGCQAPRTTRDLLRRLIRVRRGNRQLRQAAASARRQSDVPDSDLAALGIRPMNRSSWFRDVLVPQPRLLPQAAAYALLTAIAELAARRSPATTEWGRDDSTRQLFPSGPSTGQADLPAATGSSAQRDGRRI